MRLCFLLVNNQLTTSPKVKALLALMCFQASREAARLQSDGSIILLKDQDRAQWSQPLIEKGKCYLEQATAGDDFSEYHVEAAIAGCHATADSFEQTNWHQIIELYTILERIKPNAIVTLNKAIAIGYGQSAALGLEALKNIKELSDHYLYHAAMGDFFSDLGDRAKACSSYEQAFQLTSSNSEKKLLKTKISSIPSS